MLGPLAKKYWLWQKLKMSIVLGLGTALWLSYWALWSGWKELQHRPVMALRWYNHEANRNHQQLTSRWCCTGGCSRYSSCQKETLAEGWFSSLCCQLMDVISYWFSPKMWCEVYCWSSSPASGICTNCHQLMVLPWPHSHQLAPYWKERWKNPASGSRSW